MRERDIAELLREHDIQPSAQRVVVAAYVLNTTSHPTADQVWQKVRKEIQYISRATVYNTLNLMVKKGLLRYHILSENGGLFDPNIRPHHHFVDEKTGRVQDIPWDTLKIAGLDSLLDYDITECMVVIRGRRKRKK
jgi:Fe2+ or Zn2+ uptake regulation protein